MEHLIITKIAVLGIKTTKPSVENLIQSYSEQKRCVVHVKAVPQKLQSKCAMTPTVDMLTLVKVIAIGTMARRVCVVTLTPVISMQRRCVVHVMEAKKLS